MISLAIFLKTKFLKASYHFAICLPVDSNLKYYECDAWLSALTKKSMELSVVSCVIFISRGFVVSKGHLLSSSF